MNPNLLEFEQPVAELEAKIVELRQVGAGNGDVNISEEIERLEAKCRDLLRSIFSNLTAWQVAQIARHPLRPFALDYIERIFTSFHELHGDRLFADDPAIVGGIGRLDGIPVMVIAHQKGRDVKEKLRRNFGMPRPEGYRKALRLMELAERFRLPVLTLIDTPGAYPGVDAEARGQSEAIARNLQVMAGLRTPVIATVIGEGGSGGALAIGVADRLVMLEYATYSVISPEGCASILWKSADRAEEAAEALRITAGALRELGLIDRVVDEPLGGAHRDPTLMAERVKLALRAELEQLDSTNIDAVVAARYERLMQLGQLEDLAAAAPSSDVTDGVHAAGADGVESSGDSGVLPPAATGTGNGFRS